LPHRSVIRENLSAVLQQEVLEHPRTDLSGGSPLVDLAVAVGVLGQAAGEALILGPVGRSAVQALHREEVSVPVDGPDALVEGERVDRALPRVVVEHPRYEVVEFSRRQAISTLDIRIERLRAAVLDELPGPRLVGLGQHRRLSRRDGGHNLLRESLIPPHADRYDIDPGVVLIELSGEIVQRVTQGPAHRVPELHGDDTGGRLLSASTAPRNECRDREHRDDSCHVPFHGLLRLALHVLRPASDA